MKILERSWPHDNEFEKLVQQGEISFQKSSLEDLNSWTKSLIELYLSKIKWELGDIGLKDPGSNGDPSLIIKIYGVDGINYLDSYPTSNQFMWVKDLMHSEGVHPDVAMFILLKFEGSVVVDEKGRSVIELRVGDGMIIIDGRERGSN